MSCENNLNNVAGTAAPPSGVSATQSKLTGIVGRTFGAINRARGTAATRALAVVDSVDMPQSIDSLAPVAAVGALVVGNDDPVQLAKKAMKLDRYFEPGMSTEEMALADERVQFDRQERVRLEQNELDRQKNKTRLFILNTLAAAQVGRAVGTALTVAASRLSEDKTVPVNVREFFGREGPGLGPRAVARTWSSKLTPLLNAADVFGQAGVKVCSSGGMMWEHDGTVWHQGQTVVETSAGKRHITHLQRMSVPKAHYYFSGPLQETEVAGIITGNSNYLPRTIPGYAGQISEVEALCPAWSDLKHAVIKTHLLWGDTPAPRNMHEILAKDDRGRIPRK